MIRRICVVLTLIFIFHNSHGVELFTECQLTCSPACLKSATELKEQAVRLETSCSKDLGAFLKRCQATAKQHVMEPIDMALVCRSANEYSDSCIARAYGVKEMQSSKMLVTACSYPTAFTVDCLEGLQVNQKFDKMALAGVCSRATPDTKDCAVEAQRAGLDGNQIITLCGGAKPHSKVCISSSFGNDLRGDLIVEACQFEKAQ